MLSSQRYSVLIPAFCALVPVLGLGLLCATLNYPLSSSRTLYCMSLPTSAQTWHTCYLIFPQPCSCMTSVRCRSECRVNDNEYVTSFVVRINISQITSQFFFFN